MSANNLIEKLNELHTEFKSAIERSDTAATERLNTAIDAVEAKLREVEKAANRPSASETTNAADLEAKAAYVGYLRTARLEGKAGQLGMSASTSSEGGYTVPKVIANEIQKLLVDVSPIRSIARVDTISTPDYHIPFSVGGTAATWVGEKTARTQTNASTLTEIVPPMGELFASPYVTQQLIEDSQFDIAGFVSDEVATAFAAAEGAAFINGTGSGQPSGLLTPTFAATADASRAFGTVQCVPTGTAGSFGTSNQADVLVNTTMSLKAGYRQGAVWVMSKATLGVIRTFKDTVGQYLWQPSVQAGTPSMLCGYPVIEAEDMPGVAAGNFPVLFGNFQRAYRIVDRVGMSMLYDNISAYPYIAYKFRKRVGGTVVDSAAYKAVKIAAS